MPKEAVGCSLKRKHFRKNRCTAARLEVTVSAVLVFDIGQLAALYQTRSTANATALPPPRQRAAMPFDLPYRSMA